MPPASNLGKVLAIMRASRAFIQSKETKDTEIYDCTLGIIKPFLYYEGLDLEIACPDYKFSSYSYENAVPITL